MTTGKKATIFLLLFLLIQTFSPISLFAALVAPVFSVTTGDNYVGISWKVVSGATSYKIWQTSYNGSTCDMATKKVVKTLNAPTNGKNFMVTNIQQNNSTTNTVGGKCYTVQAVNSVDSASNGYQPALSISTSGMGADLDYRTQGSVSRTPVFAYISDSTGNNFYNIKGLDLTHESTVGLPTFGSKYTNADTNTAYSLRMNKSLEYLLTYRDSDDNAKDWLFNSLVTMAYDYGNYTINGGNAPTKTSWWNLIDNKYFGDTTSIGTGFLERINSLVESEKAALNDPNHKVYIFFDLPWTQGLYLDRLDSSGNVTQQAPCNDLYAPTGTYWWDEAQTTNLCTVAGAESAYDQYISHIYSKWAENKSNLNNLYFGGFYWAQERIQGYSNGREPIDFTVFKDIHSRLVNINAETDTYHYSDFGNVKHNIYYSPYTSHADSSVVYQTAAGDDTVRTALRGMSYAAVFQQPNNWTDYRYETSSSYPGTNPVYWSPKHYPGYSNVDGGFKLAKMNRFGVNLEFDYGENYYNLGVGETTQSSGIPYGEKKALSFINGSENVSPFIYYIEKAKAEGLAKSWSPTIVYEKQGTLAQMGLSQQYKYRQYYDLLYSFLNNDYSDTTDPVISGVTKTIKTNSVDFGWNTQEITNGNIYWGTSTSYGQPPVHISPYNTSQTAVLAGLNPNTTYYYKINATDPSGNTGVYTGSFRTLGVLHHITISPSSTQNITSGQTIQFTAQGQDASNVNIPGLAYTWSGTNSSGSFTNKTQGTYQVKASVGTLSSPTVTVNVAAGALDHINISPVESQYLTVGQKLQFNAQGQDINNNNKALSYSWVGTDSKGLFTAATPGTYSVKASSGAISSPTVTVIVSPVTLTSSQILNSVKVSSSIGFSNVTPAAGETLAASYSMYNSNSYPLTLDFGMADQSTATGKWNSFTSQRVTIPAYSKKQINFSKLVKYTGSHRSWICMGINGNWYDAKAQTTQMTSFTYNVHTPNIRLDTYAFNMLPPRPNTQFNAKLKVTNLESRSITLDYLAIPIYKEYANTWNTMKYSPANVVIAPGTSYVTNLYQALSPGYYKIWPSIIAGDTSFTPKTKDNLEMYWWGWI